MGLQCQLRSQAKGRQAREMNGFPLLGARDLLQGASDIASLFSAGDRRLSGEWAGKAGEPLGWKSWRNEGRRPNTLPRKR